MHNTGESIDLKWGKMYGTYYYKIVTNNQSYCKMYRTYYYKIASNNHIVKFHDSK